MFSGAARLRQGSVYGKLSRMFLPTQQVIEKDPPAEKSLADKIREFKRSKR